jgi:hypothetical protein
MTGNIWDGSQWKKIKTIKVYNGSSWENVNKGKVYDGSGNFNTFYTRLNKVTPDASSTETITYSEIRFLVTQGDEAQYAEFPATVEALITKPGTVEYSQIRTDRIAEFAVTGLSQNQTVTMKYRLNYGDNEYFPEDQSYLSTDKTTTAITKLAPTITYIDNGYGTLTYSINKRTADSAYYELVRVANTTVVKTGTITTTANFTLTGLNAGESYFLRSYGNYETYFSPDETSSITTDSNRFTAIKTATNPSITDVGRTTSSVTFGVDIGLADYFTYTLTHPRTGDNIYIETNPQTWTQKTFNAANTGDSIYPDESYRLTVTAYWSDATSDYTIGIGSISTNDFTSMPPSTSVSISSRSVAELIFNHTRLSGSGTNYSLETTGGDVYASGTLTATGDISVGGLPHNTSFLAKTTAFQTGYRSDRYSGGTRFGSTNSASSSTRLAQNVSSLVATTQYNTPNFNASFALNGTGTACGYNIRRQNTGVVVASGTDSISPVARTVTRGFSYRIETEQRYDSIRTGTQYAFGSNSTFGIARLNSAYIFAQSAQ